MALEIAFTEVKGLGLCLERNLQIRQELSLEVFCKHLYK